MPKKIKLKPHLSTAELEKRYREARDPVERSHYQIVWLIAQGKTTTEVNSRSPDIAGTGSSNFRAATTREVPPLWGTRDTKTLVGPIGRYSTSNSEKSLPGCSKELPPMEGCGTPGR
jgi:hypothetical protein